MNYRFRMYIFGVIIASIFLILPSLLTVPTADANVPAALPTRTLPPISNGDRGNDDDTNSSKNESGALVGYVWDVFEEAHVANVIVKANGLETATDQDGFFAFNNLPIGTYEITVEIPDGGLPEYSSATVKIEDDQIWDLDLSFASQPLPESQINEAEMASTSAAGEFTPILANVTVSSDAKPGDVQKAKLETDMTRVTVAQMNYPLKAEVDAFEIMPPMTLATRKATSPTNSALESCASSPVSVYKGDDPEMIVTPGLVNHEIGQEGCIRIDVSNVVDMGAFQGELHFDADLIEIKSVTLGDFLGQVNRQVTLVSEANDQDGIIYLGTFSSGKAAAPNGGGTLVIIKFTTKAEGRSEVNLVNVLSTDHMGNDNVQGKLNITNGIIRSTACFGDLNTDKQININDIQGVAGRIDKPSLYDEKYDFNADGVIDNEDINIITERWNQNCG